MLASSAFDHANMMRLRQRLDAAGSSGISLVRFLGVAERLWGVTQPSMDELVADMIKGGEIVAVRENKSVVGAITLYRPRFYTPKPDDHVLRTRNEYINAANAPDSWRAEQYILRALDKGGGETTLSAVRRMVPKMWGQHFRAAAERLAKSGRVKVEMRKLARGRPTMHIIKIEGTNA